MMKAKKFELEFVKKKRESSDTFSFYFKWPNKDFNFNPGQFIKMYLNIENVDERGASRYFTISSSPYEKEYLTITTRIIKSSFKKRLVKLRKGEKISAFGPIGYFNFNPKNKHKNIFLAGGIGVTPFISIIKTFDLLEKFSNSDIYLFAFFPNKEDIIFYEDLKKIEKRHNNIKIIYSLTREVLPNFENSRLSEDLLKRYLEDYETSNYFIIGSESIVNSMFEYIKNIGVAEENIFKEDFPGY